MAQLLTTKQVAGQLGASRSSLSKMLDDSGVPGRTDPAPTSASARWTVRSVAARMVQPGERNGPAPCIEAVVAHETARRLARRGEPAVPDPRQVPARYRDGRPIGAGDTGRGRVASILPPCPDAKSSGGAPRVQRASTLAFWRPVTVTVRAAVMVRSRAHLEVAWTSRSISRDCCRVARPTLSRTVSGSTRSSFLWLAPAARSTEGGTYQQDRRWAAPDNAEPTPVLVIDNVPSQANRLEAALRRHRESLSIPELVLDLSALPHLSAHLPRHLSSLEFPHRNADAYLRDAQLKGKDFLKTELGRAIFGADAQACGPLDRVVSAGVALRVLAIHLG